MTADRPSASEVRSCARLLTMLASDMERRGLLTAGTPRRAARFLVELALMLDDGEHACPMCGGPVEQTGKGRPRVFCSDRCRNRDAKRKRKETLPS